MDQPSPPQTPVIVVGASLVGLSAALCLATQGVQCIVLERHAGVSKHPRAMGYTPRTLEIFNWLGIADRIPEVPKDFSLMRARVESLTGKWFESTSWSDVGKPSEQQKRKEETIAAPKQYSRFRGAAMPQDQLEYILETEAIERGVDIRRRNKLQDIEQDRDGVTVTATDSQGQQIQLRASYVIAADGNRSSIRDQLKIGRRGRGYMETLRSVLFRAPLDEYLQGVHQFNIDQPDLKAFMTTYRDGRWVLMFHDDIERDEKTLLSCIHQAIGKDLPVEIITTGRWEMAALVADTFQSGRIFLAGDAAHTLPPNRGGYGANTGIADVDNLAWKLAAVLAGTSTTELLDTYDAERRPVALLRHDQIFVRADYKVHLDQKSLPGEKIDDDAMEFGQSYSSNGFIGVRDELPVAMKPDEWNGHPGTRIPHIWLTHKGKIVSLQDIVGGSWTLISGTDEWEHVVYGINTQSALKLQHLHPDIDVQLLDRGASWQALGLSEAGAILVRPDGYIAWRTSDMPSKDGLQNALSQVAFTPLDFK